MTERKEALQLLLAKVEVGDSEKCGLFLKLARMSFPHHDKLMHSAYNGSLDAAKALHEAVLPDWSYIVGINWAEVWLPFSGLGKYNIGHTTPARAWLIAILKALIAQCDNP